MDRGNNIGTYIFWSLVLCIVIALVVTIVVIIPKGSGNSLSNINNAEDAFSEVIFEDYTLTNWTNEVINYDSISQENKDKLGYYQEIMFLYFTNNYFVENATTFVDRNEHFGKLNKAQNDALKVINEKLDDITDYIKNQLASFLDDDNIDSNIANSQYIAVYAEKYGELTKAYAEFFKVTADLIDKCAVRGIEVNLYSITVYNCLTDACERLLALQDVDKTELFKLVDLSNQYCDRDNYKEYYNNHSVIVTEASEAFADVAGGA